MIELSDLILKVENVVSDEDCDFLVNEFERNRSRSFKESSLEANELKHKESSVDMFSLKPGGKAFKMAHQYTNKMIEIYDKYLGAFEMFMNKSVVESFMCSHNYRVLCYSEGQSIHDHIDADHFTVFGSCSLLLNDDYDGGKFSFFKGNYEVETKKGDALIFPASGFFVHGVTEVKSGKKYSVNSFLCTRNFYQLQKLPFDPLYLQNFVHPYCEQVEKEVGQNAGYGQKPKEKLTFSV